MSQLSVDRGGLSYQINVAGNWKGEIEAFRKQIESLRQRQKKARSTAAGGNKQSREQRELTRQQKISAKAFSDIAKESRKAEEAQRRAVISQKQGNRVEQIAVTQAQARSAALRQITAASSKAAIAQERYNRLTKNGNRISEEQAKVFGVVKERLARLTSAEKDAERQARNRASAEQKLNNILDRRAKVLATSRLLAKRGGVEQFTPGELQALGLASKVNFGKGRSGFAGVSSEMEQVQTRTQRLTDQFKKMGQSIFGANSAANRVSFTFRRLFGILAAFTVARQAAQAIVSLIRDTIRYAAAIETAELGIASLLTAVGQLASAQGRTVTGAEALALAQIEARRQTRLLRVEALKTAATFDELAEAFQVGLAPGLRAGLSVDQVREFAVSISKAAANLNLPQNQLAEEIRSVLEGTIQARTTRIATALGISNEDIRQAKEAGRLAAFLATSFEAFDVAGGEAAKTFNVIVTNFRDALLLATSTGADEFFESLKNNIQALTDLITEQDKVTGELVISPTVLATAQAFGSILSDVQDALKEVGSSIGFQGLANSLDGLGTTLRFLLDVLTGGVQGAIASLSVLRTIIVDIADLFSTLTGGDIFGESTSGAAKKLAFAIAAIYVSLTAVGLVLRSIFTVAKIGLTVANFATLGLVNSLGTKLLPVLNAIKVSLAASLKLAAIQLALTTKAVTGPLLTGLKAIRAVLVSIIALLGGSTGVAFVFKTLPKIALAVGAALSIWGIVLSGILLLLKEVLSYMLGIDLTFEQFFKTLLLTLTVSGKAIRDMFDRVFVSIAIQALETVATIKKAFDSLGPTLFALSPGAGLLASVSGGFGDGSAEEMMANNLRDYLAASKKSLAESQNALDDFINNIGEGADKPVRSVADIFADLPGLIISSRAPLSELSDIAGDFEDRMKEAQRGLREFAILGGLSGSSANIGKASFDLLEEEADAIKKLDEEYKNLTSTIKANTQDLDKNNQKIKELDDSQQKKVNDLIRMEKSNADYIEALRTRQSDLPIDDLLGRKEIQGQIEEQTEAHQKRLEAIKQGVDISAKEVGLAKEHLYLTYNLRVAEQGLTENTKDRTDLQKLTVELLNEQLSLVAQKGQLEARNDANALSRQRRFDQAVASGRDFSEDLQLKVELRARLAQAQELQKIDAERSEKEVAAIDEQIKSLKNRGASEETLLHLQGLRYEEQRKSEEEAKAHELTIRSIQQDSLDAEIAASRTLRELQRQRETSLSSLFGGLLTGSRLQQFESLLQIKQAKELREEERQTAEAKINNLKEARDLRIKEGVSTSELLTLTQNIHEEQQRLNIAYAISGNEIELMGQKQGRQLEDAAEAVKEMRANIAAAGVETFSDVLGGGEQQQLALRSQINAAIELRDYEEESGRRRLRELEEQLSAKAAVGASEAELLGLRRLVAQEGDRINAQYTLATVRIQQLQGQFRLLLNESEKASNALLGENETAAVTFASRDFTSLGKEEAILEVRIQQAIRLREIERFHSLEKLQDMNKQIALQKQMGASAEQIAVMTSLVADEQDRVNIAYDTAGIKINILKDEQAKLANAFLITADDIKTKFFELGDVIADNFVDLFDPAAISDFRNALADFFFSTAKQLASLIIQAFLLKTVLNGLDTPGGGIFGSILGFAKGGPVKGFARGGASDPRDTIPALLRPNEFVMRPEAVANLGIPLLNALNSMSFDPSKFFRSMPTLPTRYNSSPGRAMGGPITSSQAPASSSLQPAVVVASEQSFDVLVRGGRNAMLRFISENRSEVKTRLG